MKGIGPFLNRDFGYADRPRALFSKLPVGFDALVDYKIFFDDFISFDAQLDGSLTGTIDGTIVDTVTPTAAEVNTQLKEIQDKINKMSKYQIIKDTGASVALSADAENGAIVLTSTATTDNDGALIQNHQTTFLCKSGKELWFEARVKVSDADQGEMFIGLADESATNPEAVIVDGLARVGFELVDGSAVLRSVIDNDTTPTRETLTGYSMADDTYIKLGFRSDGASVRFYVNRALVKTMSIPSAIAAVTLGPAFFHLSGDATGTHTATCDYILAAQKR